MCGGDDTTDGVPAKDGDVFRTAADGEAGAVSASGLYPTDDKGADANHATEKIVEIKLDGEEKAKFEESVQAARNTNAKLGDALK